MCGLAGYFFLSQVYRGYNLPTVKSPLLVCSSMSFDKHSSSSEAGLTHRQFGRQRNMILLKKQILRERESFLSSVDPEWCPWTLNLMVEKVPHGTGLHRAWGSSETSQTVRWRANVDRVKTAVYSLYQCIKLRFHNETRVQVKKYVRKSYGHWKQERANWNDIHFFHFKNRLEDVHTILITAFKGIKENTNCIRRL